MRLVHLCRKFAAAHLNHVIRNASLKPHVFRYASAKEIDLFTQRAIGEGWLVGPDDYQCGYAFDRDGFYVQALTDDHEIVNLITAMRHPNSHSHIGGPLVSEKFRGKGYYTQGFQSAMDHCDTTYTIGGESAPSVDRILEYEGTHCFTKVWDTYAVSFNIQTIVNKLAMVSFPSNILVKSLSDVQLENFIEYDRSVFGTDRRVFMEKWISAPGSFGYVAVDGNDKIVGYVILKQAYVRGAGTEIGLAIAPLYSDDPHIAKCLLKTAAERCLANEAVPKTKLEMVHPVGDICGEGAPLLMKELEAEMIRTTSRMYTKGAPLGRQTKKIYGIASPAFD